MHRRRSDPEQRRRLLLLEEAARQGPAADSEPPVAKGAARPQVLYPQEAQRDGMVRLADLIPRRNWVLALWWLLGMGVIALLEWLYALMPRVAGMTTDGRVAALDLDGEGSLAVWYSSTLLLLASGLSWFIYTVRRHRLDDYKARYRFWLLACGMWLLMSIDETGSLHEGFKEMMSYLTGTRIAGDGSLWWVAAYLLVLVPLGVFLLGELLACPSALVALVLTALCYAVAVLAQLQWIWPQSGARGVMLEEGAEMAGHLFLVLALVLYARTLLAQLHLAPQDFPKRKPAKESTRRSETKNNRRSGPKQNASSANAVETTPTSLPQESSARSASPSHMPVQDQDESAADVAAPQVASDQETAADAKQQVAEQAELQLLGQTVTAAPGGRKKKKRKKKKKR